MSARHTGKLVENGKACERAHNGNKLTLQLHLTTAYPYKLKSKLPKINKMIEQDQNTNRGHPPNSIQVCPVTPVKL